MKINIIFHSMYGHIYTLAQEIAAGARESSGSEIKLYQVPELLSDEVLSKMGALETRKTFNHIPIATVECLEEADALIFGTPTRFGNMTAQMRSFLDATGQLWFSGALIGKVGSVFVSTATQHGGHESTILSFHTTLLHHGMVIVGVPYSQKGLMLSSEVSGGSPYGAGTIAGADGTRLVTDNEREIARFQGRYVAEITNKLRR